MLLRGDAAGWTQAASHLASPSHFYVQYVTVLSNIHAVECPAHQQRYQKHSQASDSRNATSIADPCRNWKHPSSYQKRYHLSTSLTRVSPIFAPLENIRMYRSKNPTICQPHVSRCPPPSHISFRYIASPSNPAASIFNLVKIYIPSIMQYYIKRIRHKCEKKTHLIFAFYIPKNFLAFFSYPQPC
jgi:hypothetical protein